MTEPERDEMTEPERDEKGKFRKRLPLERLRDEIVTGKRTPRTVAEMTFENTAKTKADYEERLGIHQRPKRPPAEPKPSAEAVFDAARKRREASRVIVNTEKGDRA